MPAISLAEVREIALLARLELGEDELARLGRDLEAILGYVDKLSAVDTAGVEPMTHAVPLDCPLRPDAVGPSLPADEALAGAPQRIADYFGVPRILPVEP